MHNNRTIFNWDHLQNFYNLNNVNCSWSPTAKTQEIPFINKNLNYLQSRKFSTATPSNTPSPSYRSNFLINLNNSNKLQKSNNFKFNNNLFFSTNGTVIYNNTETEKLQILKDTKNKAGVYL